jgi:hypothetical protein
MLIGTCQRDTHTAWSVPVSEPDKSLAPIPLLLFPLRPCQSHYVRCLFRMPCFIGLLVFVSCSNSKTTVVDCALWNVVKVRSLGPSENADYDSLVRKLSADF